MIVLLLLILAASGRSASAGGPPPFYRDCPNTPGGTYVRNSTFGANLAALAPDVVYGVALCRGDSKRSVCAGRLADAFAAAMNESDSPVCELHRNVTLYYDRRQLRFADRDFLSGYRNAPEWVENNTNFVNASVARPFQERVAVLLNATALAATGRPDRYAAGEAWFEEGGRPVYALAQCTRDMDSERCGDCLRGVISEMPRKLNASQIGGRVIGVRCIVRYEMDPSSRSTT